MVLIENRSWVRARRLRDPQQPRRERRLRRAHPRRRLAHRDPRQPHPRHPRPARDGHHGLRAPTPAPISDLVIDGNEIYDCEPATSEALTLNGNVDGFAVTNNVVRDVNNIGIDFIGGETDIQPDPTQGGAQRRLPRQPRRARALELRRRLRRRHLRRRRPRHRHREQRRHRVRPRHRDRRRERRHRRPATSSCATTSLYAQRQGRPRLRRLRGARSGGCATAQFRNNTLLPERHARRGLRRAVDPVRRGQRGAQQRLRTRPAQNLLLVSDAGNVDNALDYNLWFADGGAGGGALRLERRRAYAGFAAYRAATGQDARLAVRRPAAGRRRRAATSTCAPARRRSTPAIPAFVAGARRDRPRRRAARQRPARRRRRRRGRPAATASTEPRRAVRRRRPRSTATAATATAPSPRCGNGVVTAGEQCDDGNTARRRLLRARPASSRPTAAPCDDGNLCTNADACSAGACSGADGAGAVVPRRGADVAGDPRPAARHARPARLAVEARRRGRPRRARRPGRGATRYALCVYETTRRRAGARPRAARDPGGGLCRGKPCWKALGTAGFKLADRDRTPDGVESLLLRAGPAGKSSIVLTAKGANLAPPALPLGAGSGGDGPAAQRAGACFGASYAAPAQKNDAAQFRDKTP